MRIKGAGQFGGQGPFFLYVTTCDSCRCVQQSVQLGRCHARRLSMIVCVLYFTGATIVLLRPTYIQLPPPNKPSPYHYHCSRCPMPVVVHSSMFCFPRLSFPSCAAYYTCYAQLDSEFCFSTERTPHSSSMIIKASSGRQSIPMRCIPYTLRPAWFGIPTLLIKHTVLLYSSM